MYAKQEVLKFTQFEVSKGVASYLRDNLILPANLAGRFHEWLSMLQTVIDNNPHMIPEEISMQCMNLATYITSFEVK